MASPPPAPPSHGEGDLRPYDLVLSNIISAALIRFAKDVARVTKPGGRWIVSGILKPNWADVKKAAEKAGFRLHKKVEEDDWVAAIFLR